MTLTSQTKYQQIFTMLSLTFPIVFVSFLKLYYRFLSCFQIRGGFITETNFEINWIYSVTYQMNLVGYLSEHKNPRIVFSSSQSSRSYRQDASEFVIVLLKCGFDAMLRYDHLGHKM